MSVHVTPIRVYLMVFGILMVGTALTVWAAFLHLGPFNDVVALAIAVTKATFVVLYFMHVRHSTRLTKVTVVAGFLWLAILVALTLSDYFTRGFLAG
jgi:cytochrome c oxidase subunit 4